MSGPRRLARALLDRGGLAAWTAEDRHALLAVCGGTRPLIEASGGAATLVHSDFNPKNLLVDPDRAEVTGLLDWEFADAGHPLTDLGNLLRFPPRRWEPGLRALTGGVLELLGAAGLPSGWLETARALDLFALVELAARERRNPVVDRARELLLATARTGSLAAGRPTPRAGRL
jgi:aminoglycoside phosphotransferase (APT) family kinase protein